ncbi:MAG: YqhV family protein [Firmicutes bacterium]|nr:YqhV family protein [Bacillota bacterium]
MLADRVAASGMGAIRMVSALAELTGAVLMFHFGSAEKALRVNAVLSLVGPVVLLTTTALGISALVGKLPAWKLAAIAGGAGLIFFAATHR